MIVTDTNVLSEPMRPVPEPAVLDWLSANSDQLALTSISVGELLTGVRLLPEGRRRDGLHAAIENTLSLFAERVLAYDAAAARVYADLRELRHSSGRALSVEDGMIAAICISRRATLATRNVKDFEGLGVIVVNPWD